VESVGRVEDGYRIKVRIKLGQISGVLNTSFKYVDVSEESIKVVGTSEGLQSVINFTISLKLEERNNETHVNWKFEGDIKGLITVLRSFLDILAKQIIEDTIKNLKALLNK